MHFAPQAGLRGRLQVNFQIRFEEALDLAKQRLSLCNPKDVILRKSERGDRFQYHEHETIFTARRLANCMRGLFHLNAGHRISWYNFSGRILQVQFRSGFLLLSFFFLTSTISAEPKLPHLFGDHMVLQRDAAIRVWGWADPGEAISVALAGQTQQTTAGADSRWHVELAALHAGGPFVLQIRGKKTLEFKDVMIGEVWVASGQSNMAFGLGGAANAQEVVPKADDPGLRFFTVPKKIAMEPQTDTLPAAWEVCTSETAKKFSAVAYFFARDLRRSLQVPVGIILSAWPGTAAEEWTPVEFTAEGARFSRSLPNGKNPRGDKQFAAGSRDFSLEFDDFALMRTDSTAVSSSIQQL